MLPTALLALALAAAPSHAIESPVGNENKFGVGATVGVPVDFTGKYLFNEKMGVAFHVGAWFTGYSYMNGRVQFEHRVLEFAQWDFGSLGLYWNAGIENRLWFGRLVDHATYGFGITGGAGPELRFAEYPAAVFIETDIQIMPFDPGYGMVGYVSCIGGRWYL